MRKCCNSVLRQIFIVICLFLCCNEDIIAIAQKEIECDFNSTEDLWLNTEETFGAMLTEFGGTCDRREDCKASRTPIRTLTVKDFNNLKSTSGDNNEDVLSVGPTFDFYEQYHDACVESGMTMCYISTTVKMNSNSVVDSSALAVAQVVRELNKPICFPKSCSENQVEILNPYPNACTIAGNICEIMETSIVCSENRVVEGDASNCEADVPGPFSTVNINKLALSNQMDARCAEVVLGGSNDYCFVRHVWAEVIEFTNYTSFRQNSIAFQRFGTNCNKNGGQQCFADFNLLRGISLGTAGINYNITGVDYPFCFPKDCSQSSLTKMAGDVIMTNFGTVDVGGEIGVVDLCNLPNGGCYFGYNFYCGEREMLILTANDDNTLESQSASHATHGTVNDRIVLLLSILSVGLSFM